MNALCEGAWPQLNEVSPFPVPPPNFSDPSVIYETTITTLRGAPTSLEALPTVGRGLLTLLFIALDSSDGAISEWRLLAGAADPTDPNGQVAPLDYDVARNNVHWAKAGGF
jgi:hypothetical protein